MLLTKNVFATVIVLGVGAGAVAGIACGDSGSPSSNGAPVSGGDAGSDAADSGTVSMGGCSGLNVAFSPMYSAYDGVHDYRIPAIVTGTDTQVSWGFDKNVVRLEAPYERANEVLIHTLAAGVTTITATSADGKCGTAQLTITATDAKYWEIGNQRYNNGNSLHVASNPTDGGSPLESDDAGGPACTNCHGEVATNSVYVNVSHTPEQTGGFSDEELLNIIQHGQFPDGGNGNKFDTSIALYSAWHGFHRWSDIAGDDQQRGIVTYLRSITPAAQNGQINFGYGVPDGG